MSSDWGPQQRIQVQGQGWFPCLEKEEPHLYQHWALPEVHAAIWDLKANHSAISFPGLIICQKHQLLSGSNHSEQHFLPPILFLTPSPVSELWDSSEACHQKPTPGLCLSLSHRRVVQVSGPRGSVSDRAMRVPAVPTGITAGERGQKSSSAPLPSSPNGSPLGSLQGSFISFPGNRM